MHKPRSPSRKQHVLKEFQFPGLHPRPSYTSSPHNDTQRIDLESSMRGHIQHFSLQDASATSTPTSATPSKLQFSVPKPIDVSLSQRYHDCQSRLEELSIEYQQALQENESLRQQTLLHDSLKSTGSASTVFPCNIRDEDTDLRQSMADEAEELCELLSDAHMSMALLLNECDELKDRTRSAKTELNTIKFQNQVGGSPRDKHIDEVLFRQLSSDLTARNEELKAHLKEKRKYEAKVQDAQKRKHDLELECRGLRDKVNILTKRSTEDYGSATEIYKKLTTARNLLSMTEDQKLESGPVKKLKKKR